MSTVPWIFRPIAIAAAILALTGCPSLGPLTTTPPSADRAQSLARQGDHAGAARIYEALAAENTGTERNALLILAMRGHLRAREAGDAARVLATIAPPLTPEQAFERQLLGIELALARSQPQQAWQQLAAISEPRAAPAVLRYLELKQKAAFAAGRPADGVRAEMARERWLTNNAERIAARRELLGALRDASERGIKVEPRTAADRTIRGWLELAALAAAAARSPGAAQPDIEAWRSRYPNHPADEAVRRELLGQEPMRPGERVAHVALLLPLSGRTSSAAGSVREGFMTAYYQTPASQRPRVRVYDTAEISAAEAIMSAVREGAELIVGPLTRDEVTAAADLAIPRPPVLALNFLPLERPAPEEFYQFALSPEDEAREVARRVISDGKRRGVVLVPEGDWGTRVLTAFQQELTAGGGFLLGSGAFDATRTDYAAEITQVLRISDSRSRHRRLESILGGKLQFEPRRRGDIEFIFPATPASIAR
jgi:uncharacterized protein